MKNIYLLFTFLFISSSLFGQLIFNELLFDTPPGLSGDANKDGIKSLIDDQLY